MKVALLSVHSTKLADILAQIFVAMLRNIVLVSDSLVGPCRPFYDIV
jgi:hypothetical protein